MLFPERIPSRSRLWSSASVSASRLGSLGESSSTSASRGGGGSTSAVGVGLTKFMDVCLPLSLEGGSFSNTQSAQIRAQKRASALELAVRDIDELVAHHDLEEARSLATAVKTAILAAASAKQSQHAPVRQTSIDDTNHAWMTRTNKAPPLLASERSAPVLRPASPPRQTLREVHSFMDAMYGHSNHSRRKSARKAADTAANALPPRRRGDTTFESSSIAAARRKLASARTTTATPPPTRPALLAATLLSRLAARGGAAAEAVSLATSGKHIAVLVDVAAQGSGNAKILAPLLACLCTRHPLACARAGAANPLADAAMDGSRAAQQVLHTLAKHSVEARTLVWHALRQRAFHGAAKARLDALCVLLPIVLKHGAPDTNAAADITHSVAAIAVTGSCETTRRRARLLLGNAAAHSPKLAEEAAVALAARLRAAASGGPAESRVTPAMEALVPLLSMLERGGTAAREALAALTACVGHGQHSSTVLALLWDVFAPAASQADEDADAAMDAREASRALGYALLDDVRVRLSSSEGVLGPEARAAMGVLGALLKGAARHGALEAGLELGATALGDEESLRASMASGRNDSLATLATALALLRHATECVEGWHQPLDQYGRRPIMLAGCLAPPARSAGATAARVLGQDVAVRSSLTAALSASADALVSSNGSVDARMVAISMGALSALSAVARGDASSRHAIGAAAARPMGTLLTSPKVPWSVRARVAVLAHALMLGAEEESFVLDADGGGALRRRERETIAGALLAHGALDGLIRMLNDPRSRRAPREFCASDAPLAAARALDQCEYAAGMYASDVVATAAGASLAVKSMADKSGVLQYADAVSHLVRGGEGGTAAADTSTVASGRGASGEAYRYARELKRACELHFDKLNPDMPSNYEVRQARLGCTSRLLGGMLQLPQIRSSSLAAMTAPPPPAAEKKKNQDEDAPSGERVRKTEIIAFTPARNSGEKTGEPSRLPHGPKAVDRAALNRDRLAAEEMKRASCAMTLTAIAFVKVRANLENDLLQQGR